MRSPPRAARSACGSWTRPASASRARSPTSGPAPARARAPCGRRALRVGLPLRRRRTGNGGVGGAARAEREHRHDERVPADPRGGAKARRALRADHGPGGLAQEPRLEVARGDHRAALAAVLTGAESGGEPVALPAQPLPEQPRLRRLRRAAGRRYRGVPQAHAHADPIGVPLRLHRRARGLITIRINRRARPPVAQPAPALHMAAASSSWAGGGSLERAALHLPANTAFQSLRMSTTVQPFAAASSRALSSFPMWDWRSEEHTSE